MAETPAGRLLRVLAARAERELDGVTVPGTEVEVLDASAVPAWLVGWAVRIDAGQLPGELVDRDR